MSATAESSVAMTRRSVSDGTEEAAMIFSNGMITSMRVSVCAIKLSFECNNLPNMDTLSKSDPFVVTYLQGKDRKWNEVGRTEIVVNSLNPMFVTRILLNYQFESVQRLRFQVYDADEGENVKNIVLERQDFIGEAETVLSELVHKKTATKLDLKLNEKSRGTITVKCEELNAVHGVVRGQFIGMDLPSSRCFYRIFNILD
ncbi:hypothetical protein JH06_3959 [Blastocystis sp. subtype 4]|uniref:hypothetical protein n=1 Tax=Blastocystis sp. subtype 4 TaxID=944170 RepID=UPI000711BEDE|nr:hypothetical protein JH06_3959 [Blastocystis sp. subtype 4]KNB42441.1 hypothetical protein JH06_3959 [Blastocystis sp. subtype 4]|eukprot:XP_014525884.1 hypothetical protein JH06_3959 [Blastocystis sp. subtype 4]